MDKKELQKAQNIIDSLFYDDKALTQWQHTLLENVISIAQTKLRQPDVVSRKSKVYVISLRKDTVNPFSRKMFLDKELAIKYWNEVGKDEYTYWEESIYNL